jgi:hypothetical protein
MNSKQPVSKPFIDERLQIRWIEDIQGWGVYTSQPIASGALIEVAPVVVYPKPLANVALWACQAEGIPVKDLKIDQYSLHWDGNNAFPLGWTGLYNHSDNPNCQFFADYQKSLLGILTTRDIASDEQLCVSYGQEWFDAKKNYITKYSF